VNTQNSGTGTAFPDSVIYTNGNLIQSDGQALSPSPAWNHHEGPSEMHGPGNDAFTYLGSDAVVIVAQSPATPIVPLHSDGWTISAQVMRYENSTPQEYLLGQMVMSVGTPAVQHPQWADSETAPATNFQPQMEPEEIAANPAQGNSGSVASAAIRRQNQPAIARSNGRSALDAQAVVAQALASPEKSTTTIDPLPTTIAVATAAKTTEAKSVAPSTEGSVQSLASSALTAAARATFSLLPDANLVVRVVGGTPATTGAGAATTTLPWATAAHATGQVISAVVPQAAAKTVVAAEAMLHVNAIDAAGLFSDALAAFANDFATIDAPTVPQTTHRAWAITAAVLAADAILLGHWSAKRSKLTKQASGTELEDRPTTPFRQGQPMIADLCLVE
jgi:hypothetical protein